MGKPEPPDIVLINEGGIVARSERSSPGLMDRIAEWWKSALPLSRIQAIEQTTSTPQEFRSTNGHVNDSNT